MKIKDTKITEAGVFRCCFAIGHGETKEFEFGDKLNCPHCNEEFVLTNELGLPLWVPSWQLQEEDNGNSPYYPRG